MTRSVARGAVQRGIAMVASCVALASAGCGQRYWAKPGATPDRTRADLSRCYQDADWKARMDANSTYLSAGTGLHGDPLTAEMQARARYDMRVQELVLSCMHQLGYHDEYR